MTLDGVIMKPNTFYKKVFDRRTLPYRIVIKQDKVIGIDLKLKALYLVRN